MERRRERGGGTEREREREGKKGACKRQEKMEVREREQTRECKENGKNSVKDKMRTNDHRIGKRREKGVMMTIIMPMRFVLQTIQLTTSIIELVDMHICMYVLNKFYWLYSKSTFLYSCLITREFNSIIYIVNQFYTQNVLS